MDKDKNACLSTSYTSTKTYEDDITSIFTWAEFTKEADITEERAKEFLELGWLQAANAESDQAPTLEHDKTLFRQIDVFKARKANRLCMDFEMPSLAGAIIVDLLERIDDLEALLKEKE